MKKIGLFLMSAMLFLGSQTLYAAWTTTPAKIKVFYPFSNSTAWVQLDESVENVNSCSTHDDWFHLEDLNTTLGKTNFTMLQLAYSMGQKVRIASTGCNTNGSYNTIDAIRLSVDDQ